MTRCPASWRAENRGSDGVAAVRTEASAAATACCPAGRGAPVTASALPAKAVARSAATATPDDLRNNDRRDNDLNGDGLGNSWWWRKLAGLSGPRAAHLRCLCRGTRPPSGTCYELIRTLTSKRGKRRSDPR